MSEQPVRVLFVCANGSCRSPMAAALARHLGRGRLETYSAGKELGEHDPLIADVMDEIGIGLAQYRTKGDSDYAGQSFHYVITLCDRSRESCPTWPRCRAEICWSIEDPAVPGASDTERAKACRRVRDDLRHRIQLFMLSNRLTSPHRSWIKGD